MIDLGEMRHILQKQIYCVQNNDATSKRTILKYILSFQTPDSTKLNTKQEVKNEINLLRRAFDIEGYNIITSAFRLVVYFNLSHEALSLVTAESPPFRFKCQKGEDKITLESLREEDIIN
ncbi:hypothetical protein CDIK_3263 [Cucumispora dikerogammari]|nr:hypothetical protein CDIK_3263 [Cucumispora dikerogammari]